MPYAFFILAAYGVALSLMVGLGFYCYWQKISTEKKLQSLHNQQDSRQEDGKFNAT